ncbi:hypothetical protein Nmel_005633, partial [Mimus melanotis]
MLILKYLNPVLEATKDLAEAAYVPTSMCRLSALTLFITARPGSQSFRVKLTGTWVLFQLKDKPVLLATRISTMSKVK